MSEREQVLPVRNDGSTPLTVVLEPSGARHIVAPGGQVLVVARGPSGGQLEVEHGVDELIVRGWNASHLDVVRDESPRARSAYECRLYIELNPHGCGESTFHARSGVNRTKHGLVATYEGACPRCTTPRRFDFILDDHPTPPAPAYGGPSPSTLIDPGQFMIAAQEAAAADDQLATAVAALDEVIKFIPPGQDRVPASAFTSVQGKAAYQSEPARFERVRLGAVLAQYRDGLRAAKGS